MKLSDFVWIADENIHPDLCKEVSAYAKVCSLNELDLLGAADSEILHKAQSINALVITHDSDFGKLAFLENKLFIGVVFLRPGHLSSAFHLITLRQIIEQDIDVYPPFLVVALHSNDQVNIRVRNRIGMY
jgi:predicted nuclease of predicted toxin-antitoxin system